MAEESGSDREKDRWSYRKTERDREGDRDRDRERGRGMFTELAKDNSFYGLVPGNS